MNPLPRMRPRAQRRWLRRVAPWSALALTVLPRALWTARPWFALRASLLPVDLARLRGHTLAQVLMEQTSKNDPSPSNGAHPAGATADGEQKKTRSQRIVLVRHGLSTFNVEGRLPGQLPNIMLTDEGRRQAHEAAVALAGLRISAFVSSPLERARETAEIIARGWAMPVREEPRLMDTDMGRWAGRKISDVAKEDPGWNAFLAKPTEPPAGVEGFEQVSARAVAVIEELRKDETVGDDVVVVAHADVIKLILAHYTGVALDAARFIVVGNASISVLAFTEGHPATVLAVNWTRAPHWLVSPAAPSANGATEPQPGAPEPETGAPSGVIM